MAVIAEIQTKIVDFHSQSSSPVFRNQVDSLNHEDCRLLPNTVDFEDDSVFDDNGLDCTEKLDISSFDYEDDVVLDSEDEGIDGSRLIRVSSTFSRSEFTENVESDEQQKEDKAAGFHSYDQKQCDIGEQVSSNDFNKVETGKDSSRAIASLSYCSSQEPGESTQVNALDFVDHFLNLNTANPSQGISNRKAVRVTSPPFSSIKGPLSLANRISRKSVEESRSFEWDEFDNQEAICNLSGQSKNESFDFRKRRRQFHAIKPRNIVKLDSKDGNSLHKEYGNKEASTDIQFRVDTIASTLPHPTSVIYSKDTHGIDLTSRMEIGNKSNKELSVKSAQESFEPMDDEGDALDELDIGFGTQIAAEAMEALSYIPVSKSIVDTHHSPKNALNSVSQDVTEHKPHLNYSSCHKIGGIVRKPKQTLQSKRKLYANCLDTPQGQYDCLELNSVLTTKRKPKKGKLSMERQLNNRNSSNGSNYSATSSNLLSDAGNCQLIQRDHTNGDLVTSTSLRLGIWSHPRRRRTPHNYRSDPNKSSNQNNTLIPVDRKGSNFISMKKVTKTDDNQEMREPISILSSYPHRNAFAYNSDRNMAGQVYDESCSAVRISPSTDASRSSFKCDDYHKSTCNRNQPKSSFLKELAKLGVSELMPDLRWKDLRRRRTMALVRVCFSQHLDEVTIKQQKRVVSQLQISIASSAADATHFVADKFVRTRNMLEAIALGKPVVTQAWLESCGQASCFIDEKNYILRDTKKEKEIGFNLPVALAHATRRPLLKGLRVLITSNIRPNKEIITSLVKASQGEPVERSQIFTGKDEKIPDDLLILSCEEDYINCVPFLRKGAAVYSSELLLNGIVIQKLEHKRHKLFMDRSKGLDASDREDQ